MFDKTLTERLESSTEAHPFRATPFDKSRLLESVLDNVRRIFNERSGSCEIRLDYGMPDLNDVLGRGGTPISLALIIKQVLETFEPRLSDAVVRYVSDPETPLAVRFQASAVLRHGDEQERIAFETVIADGNRVRVRT